MRNYYKLGMGNGNRWHLSLLDTFPDGSAVDIWAYRCKPIENLKPVPFKIQIHGDRVDYNPTAFSAIVVSRRLADAIEAIAPNDIQRIPAAIEGHTGEWEVLNILTCVDCIDHDRSIIQYYPANHPTRPGKPRGVVRLILDPTDIGDKHIFHPKDWPVSVVISDILKAVFESSSISGIEYIPTTDNNPS